MTPMNIPKEIIDSDEYKENPYSRNEYWLVGIKDALGSGGGGGSAVLITKTVLANGVYNASDDGADGYSRVTVNVPAGYVFPQGTSYNDIIALTDGNGIIHDTTDNVFLYVTSEDIAPMRYFYIMLHENDEDVQAYEIHTRSISQQPYISGIKIVNPAAGKCTIRQTFISTTGSRVTEEISFTSNKLVGLFSDSSHIYSIENFESE